MAAYQNRTGFKLLNARPDRPSRLTWDDADDSPIDVQVRVWRPDTEEDDILLARIWLDGHCHHKAYKRVESLPVLAETNERREGKSFEQLERLLTTRGFI